ncbi:MAG: agmatinase family protein [Thermoleophilaceae bacterium]
MAILHAGIATFLKAPHVPPERSAIQEAGATVAVLGLPYDSTTVTRPGASHGPRAIRDASSHFAFGEYYHYDYHVTISDHLSLVDCGDVDGVPGNAAKTFGWTEQALDEIYAAGAFPVLLGGDHATTIPGARALSRHIDGRMGFVMFDTHLDTAPDIGGEELSHCTPVHRVLDLPNVDGTNVVIIGAHGAANPKVELEVAQAHGVTVFSVRDIDRMGIDEVAQRSLEIAAEGTESIYLSVDIDVLDGAYAWGTCGPEIGGMTGRELVRGLEIVSEGPLGALDCVEVAPAFDPSGNTARVGARVVIDVLAAQASKAAQNAIAEAGEAIPAP